MLFEHALQVPLHQPSVQDSTAALGYAAAKVCTTAAQIAKKPTLVPAKLSIIRPAAFTMPFVCRCTNHMAVETCMQWVITAAKGAAVAAVLAAWAADARSLGGR